LARETFLRAADPSLFARMVAASTCLLPQVNALWGISMTALGMFELHLDAGRVFAESGAFIIVVLAFGFVQFHRASRF
jgi:hypothetical protein